MKCPVCTNELLYSVHSPMDERSGYNFSISFNCHPCRLTITESSKQDKNGWCTDNAAAMKQRIEDRIASRSK